MKTKTKKSTKSRNRAKPAPFRKRMPDRGLNQDEQHRITNTSEDYDFSERNRDSIEQEEEREKRRKIEDARGAEEEY